jgi:hypothetical protein
MAGDEFVAPPPSVPQTSILNGAPPSDQWIDPTQLADAPRVGTANIGGNNYAQYQVSIGGVAYNAYANDSLYPNQAFLVPITQLDPTFSQTDFGSFLSQPGNAFAAARSSGPAARVNPVRNRTPPAGPEPVTPFSPLQNTTLANGLPPIGASGIANALAAQFPFGGMPQSPPLAPPLPMPWGVAAEGPVARLFNPKSSTLPRSYPVYDFVEGDEYTDALTFEVRQRQPITVVNRTFDGGHWISVKSTTSARVMNELEGALNDMYSKSGGRMDSVPVDPNLPDVHLRVLEANPDSATIHILIPENEAANVPSLQAQAEARVAEFRIEMGEPLPHQPGLPPKVNVRVTAWPGTELANPNPLAAPEVSFGSRLASSGAYGAGVGAGVSAFFQIGEMAISEVISDQQYSAGDYASAACRAATAGGVSGAAGTALETAFAQQVSEQFAQSILGGAARGAFGAGPAAALFQVTQMALSDQRYSAEDYIAKGGTAAIEGALSGALSASLVTAAWGSVVPGIGTGVGLLVGFVAYSLINYDFGDDIERGLRGLMK